MDRINELEKQIKIHNDAYWTKENPIITDYEYDVLVENLRKLDPKNTLLTEIGTPKVKRDKIKHDIPMLSLDKVYTTDELVAWAKSVARDSDEMFSLEAKFDGMSAEWNPGLLISRGDGEYGFDVSDRMPYVHNLPTEGSGIRGEIVVSKNIFKEKKPRRTSGEFYKNERAAASGLMNNTNPIDPEILTFLKFDTLSIKWSMGEMENAGINWNSLIEDFHSNPFPIDGLVLTLVDKSYGRSLGITGHHPRHSMALKFKNPAAVTRVLSIRWTPGKHKLTPTAILEPVEISGFTNTKASLHNMDNITKIGVRVGDLVEVERCGDIIPQVTKVVQSGSGDIPTLERCPNCDTLVEYKSPDMVCPNTYCSGRVSKNLQDTINRLGIENIGPATVDDLVDAGIDDIFKLFQMDKNMWFEIPGFAEKSAKAAAMEVYRVYTSPIEDYKVLACLNMQGLGLSMCKKILTAYDLPKLRAMSLSDLSQIEGLGGIRANELIKGLSSTTFERLIDILDIKTTKNEGKPANGTVCFTGKSSKPRSHWVKLAEEKGWEFKKTVTKDLDLLVLADVESNSSKAKKARKNGVTIMSYEDFEK